MNFFRRFSLRAKMSIIIFVVGFPVVAATCFHLCVMYHDDYKKTEQAALATAQSIAYQYNNRVEGIRNLLTALSTFPEVRHKDRTACTAIIRKILLQSPPSMNIGIADLKGNLIASGVPAHFNIADRKFFRDALRTGRFSAGECFVSRTAGKPAISFALPVPDSAGKPIAVLYETFDLSQFNKIFDARKLPVNSVLTLTDYKGSVLYNYPGQAQVKPGIADKSVLRGHLTGPDEEGVFVENGPGGVKRLSAFKRLRLHPDESPYIYIRVSTPENSVLAGLHRYIVRSITLFVLVALFAIGLNHFLVGRFFVVPIERLASVAGAVAKGDLSVRTGLQDSGAEVGVLAKSFDTMAAALETRLRERFQAEALLKASEEKLHEIFDHMSDAIFIFAIDGGVILEVNKAMCDMYGYGYDEACRLSIEDISQGEPPFSKQEALSMMSLAAKKEPQVFEWLSRRRDGHLFWSEMSMRRATISGIDSLITLVRDISERKIAEEQIKSQEAQLRTLIDNLPFQLWAMDSNGRYFMQNAVSRECWGNTIGKKPEEATIQKGIVKKWLSDNSRAFAGEVVKGEVTYPVNGENRHFYNIIAPIKTDQTLLGIMGVTIDITERKSLEAQLYHVQKLEAVGQLAGGIAHDFNNIVTAIIGYSHLLQNKTAWDCSIPGFAGQIRNCAERAAELTRGLLAFSRKQVMLTQELNLDEVVAQQQNMLKIFVGENIDFRLQLAGEELVVLADKGKLEQILMNLVVNAKDAMPNGGLLEICTSSINMDDQFIKQHGYGVPGGYACVAVRDTGCGMTPETQKKIFEPFFTTKEVGKGTGLGLAIVYGMVKQHNGYITVDSTPGKGTVFMMYLPLAGAKEKLHPAVQGSNFPSCDGMPGKCSDQPNQPSA
ncbi:MAG: PAS domain S-box protein [Geobacteraceae bacterium]